MYYKYILKTTFLSFKQTRSIRYIKCKHYKINIKHLIISMLHTCIKPCVFEVIINIDNCKISLTPTLLLQM